MKKNGSIFYVKFRRKNVLLRTVSVAACAVVVVADVAVVIIVAVVFTSAVVVVDVTGFDIVDVIEAVVIFDSVCVWGAMNIMLKMLWILFGKT